MKITKTLVVGCGGTGGYLSEPLARLLHYHPNAIAAITFCDGDTFEEDNRSRQNMEPNDVGRNKAEIAELDVRNILENKVKTDCIQDFLADERLRSWLLDAGDCPMVIAAVDNDATRKMICEELETAKAFLNSFFFLTPGNDAGEGERPAEVKGQVLWWGYSEGEDFGTNPAKLYPNIVNPDTPAPVRGQCSANAPSQPQLLAANFLAAAYTLNTITSLLNRTIDPRRHATFFTPTGAETI